MAKLIFKDYAHDSYETSETVDHLVDTFDWDEAVAETYARAHKPLYEVMAELEYDTETEEVQVLSAVVNGTKLVPA